MDFNDYQTLATRTLTTKYPKLTNKEVMVLWNAIGLSGETGEMLDMVKKGILHEHGLDIEEIKEELGDVLWYLATLSDCLGLDLKTIAKFNIEKLEKRYPNGFTCKDSIKRVDKNDK